MEVVAVHSRLHKGKLQLTPGVGPRIAALTSPSCIFKHSNSALRLANSTLGSALHHLKILSLMRPSSFSSVIRTSIIQPSRSYFIVASYRQPHTPQLSRCTRTMATIASFKIPKLSNEPNVRYLM
jgi:hypothetical protein